MPVEFGSPVFENSSNLGWQIRANYRLEAGQQGLVAACDIRTKAILPPYLALSVPIEDDNHVLVANLGQLTPLEASQVIQKIKKGLWPIDGLPFAEGEHQIGTIVIRYRPGNQRPLKLPLSPET